MSRWNYFSSCPPVRGSGDCTGWRLFFRRSEVVAADGAPTPSASNRSRSRVI
jgi:hypothetical protein